MRYSWSYLEDMLVCRIDSRKKAGKLDDSKRVNCKLNQLKDHLIESFHLQRLRMIQFERMIKNKFLKSIEKK